MTDRNFSVRDRDMSLWQSAVHRVTVSNSRLAARQVASMREAAAIHAKAYIESRRVTPLADDAALTPMNPESEAVISEVLFRMVNAQERKDEQAEVDALVEFTALVRKYSSADWQGWLQCAAEYRKYYVTGHGVPQYVTWMDQNFGVIEYRLPSTAKILMMGDWGSHMTDNVHMLRVALRELQPDAIIHLGDVYYSGTQAECTSNVLDVMDKLAHDPKIKRPPFFAIPGNHEYYSGGGGFYDMIARVNTSIPKCLQRASYFCLRTADNAWQFLGMDTGINDHVAGSPDSPGLTPSEIPWHHDKLKHFPGSTVLLSHHQLFSAKERVNQRDKLPAYLNSLLHDTFEPYFDRIAGWYWGHEHNLVMFKRGQFGLQLGRLLGCGGYEVATGEDPYKINFADVEFMANMPKLSLSPYASGLTKFYNHAFALLELSPDQIVAHYYEYPTWDSDFDVSRAPPLGRPLFTETIPQCRP